MMRSGCSNLVIHQEGSRERERERERERVSVGEER